MSARTCSPRRAGQPGWPPPHPRWSASAVLYRPGRLRRAGVGLPLSLGHLLKPLRSVKRRAGRPSGCPRRLGWGRHAWASSPLDAAFVSQTGGQGSAPAHSGDAATPAGRKTGFGCLTWNDAVVGVVAGALRSLLERAGVPKAPPWEGEASLPVWTASHRRGCARLRGAVRRAFSARCGYAWPPTRRAGRT